MKEHTHKSSKAWAKRGILSTVYLLLQKWTIFSVTLLLNNTNMISEYKPKRNYHKCKIFFIKDEIHAHKKKKGLSKVEVIY